MKPSLVPWITGLVFMLCAWGSPAEAKMLYGDKHGVRVEYAATDTGQSVPCSSNAADDPNHTTRRIRIWKVSLKITNGSGRRIKPHGPEIAVMNVDPSQGSSLDYCWYERLPNFYKIDGQSDQHKLLFGIALGVPAIVPDRTLSNSTYLYLYEDVEPRLTHWRFDGYAFLEDKKSRAKPKPPPQPDEGTSTSDSQKTVVPTSDRQPPRPANRNEPSGSLLLLIDVSGSMSGSKLRSAKQAAVDTIRKAIRNRTEIAVLAFEGDCGNPIHGSAGFTRNESELVAFVNGLTAEGGTPLATALEATSRFMRQHKSAGGKTQMILLLADGDDDCGGLDTVLAKLKKNNLLYRHETVGLEVDNAARRQLQNIATQSGGNYHGATSANLSQVFSDAVDLMRMLDMIGKFN